MAEFQHEHNDAVVGRSGTPNDEQGLAYTHTPVPGACVCLQAASTDSPGTRVHACPTMIITVVRSQTFFLCVRDVLLWMDVCAHRHFFGQ